MGPAASSSVNAHGFCHLHCLVQKSAVVGELLRQVTVSGGLFAAGKCDQSSSDIPNATLAAALGRFLSDILDQGEAAVARWRPGLAGAVGSNGGVSTESPGLQLVEDLADQLHGNLVIDSATETRFASR
ncbi:AAA family ATPase [Rhodopseudomonas sp. P2A-2r]|uniref:AAA family ATPase n=1 Tax=unclassified Rhodopseudomonas TaxID=2638247 RepID=UPI002234DF19|nr:ATP-binding protein [Rhodopseudomonas sp. P2A-2r]UZE49887.1 ATP-binding protein [Rhodopseudomonas sp. P2A-2r]